MQDLSGYIAPILTKLFNQAIERNEYPDALKATKVIEIYKAKDRTLPENYRPISLLPIIAKVFDTILNKQLMTHLTRYDILSRTQYAFRPHSNTTITTQTILSNIQNLKGPGRYVLALFIDLSKAYDTIDHATLIHKLRNNINFSDNTTTFFKSCLTN